MTGRPAGGRRKVERPSRFSRSTSRRSRPSGRARPAVPRSPRSAAPLLVVVVAVLLLLVATIRPAATPDNRASSKEVPVTTSALSCPTFTDGRGKPAAQILGATTASGGSGGDDGSRSAVALPGDEPVKGLAGEQAAWSKASVSRGRAVVVTATGGYAPGAVAFAATEPPDSLGGGLAVSACSPQEQERWFVGAGSTAEHQTAVVLTNTSQSQGVVDLELLGPDGPVESVGGSGIVVDPGKVEVVRVEDLAAGEETLAVRAIVRRGAVSAAALDTERNGTEPIGSDWLPATQAPGRRRTVTGVPADADGTLMVANPGDRTATVTLEVSSKSGLFTPTSLKEVEVDPSSIATVDLPGDVAKSAYSVVLSSDEPVTATVRGRDGGDLAYAAAQDPVRSAAVVPLDLGDTAGPGDATLALMSARPDQDVEVEVTAYDRSGKPKGTRALTVTAGQTVELEPATEGEFKGKPSYLVLSTDDPVRGAVTFATSDGVSALPLTDLVTTVEAPAAEPAS